MSNPSRFRDFLGFCGPRLCAFAPAGRAPEASQAGASAGARPSRPSRRHERPLGAAFNPYRKFSQQLLHESGKVAGGSPDRGGEIP